MAHFYLDSSALVKYYVIERGTNWVRELIDARLEDQWQHSISTTLLSVAEVTAAFHRRRRMGEITKKLCAALVSRYLRDDRERQALIRADESVVNLAAELTERHPLRAYDAVQLATALILNRSLLAERLPALTFVSADDVLCAAARAEGLLAENPNEHEELMNGT
ncbi:MAG: type II toxin-antitoxin system VapC family toxin [Anaerolineae bacterium]|nr:type II toxin-antitoxin system VapC family toxin [Anaerolineae bacterium]